MYCHVKNMDVPCIMKFIAQMSTNIIAMPYAPVKPSQAMGNMAWTVGEQNRCEMECKSLDFFISWQNYASSPNHMQKSPVVSTCARSV